jgi:hypothetical protein
MKVRTFGQKRSPTCCAAANGTTSPNLAEQERARPISIARCTGELGPAARDCILSEGAYQSEIWMKLLQFGTIQEQPAHQKHSTALKQQKVYKILVGAHRPTTV